MPTVKCVCGRQFTASPDAGIVSQRDQCLDWFSKHLNEVRAARREARSRQAR